jgi:hypothetical protein
MPAIMNLIVSRVIVVCAYVKFTVNAQPSVVQLRCFMQGSPAPLIVASMLVHTKQDARNYGSSEHLNIALEARCGGSSILLPHICCTCSCHEVSYTC